MNSTFPARMWEVRESGSILQAAERAAEAGNYTAAENLLRKAARLQEASLGPRHPDLANTLNNLAIVCERTQKPDEAEQYFRRAVSIARTSLAPDHPFVATSQKNLHDFCEARGQQGREETPEAASKRLFYRVAVGALGPIAMLMVVLAAGLPRLGAPEQAAPLPAIAVDSSRDVAPPPEPAPVDAIPGPEEPTTPARPVVITARLCGELEDWLCDPADRPVPPGPLFFYAQIKSASATTVQHLWYQDDRVHQNVTLRVEASRIGYRTFSRSLMTSDSAGGWRVELRSEDGTLLHEERFTVR
jgi:tetratricopeptide (TPR) repeat protein